MRSLLTILIGLFLIFSCSNSSKKKNDLRLSNVEELIKYDADSAYLFLNEIVYSQNQSQPNLPNYILLLVDIDNSRGRYLLSNDSLLDIALHCFENQGNTLYEGKALFYKGQIWAGLSNNEDALNYYFKSLDKLSLINDQSYLSKIYSKITDVYFDDFLFDEALKTLDKSYRLDSISDLKKEMIVTLGRTGQAYLYLDEPNKAIEYFNKAQLLSNELNDSINLKGFIYKCFSAYYSVIGDNEKALEYTLRSIQNSNDNDEMGHNYLALGEAYIIRNQFDSARFYLTKSVVSDDIFTRTASYNMLYELEAYLENYKEALQYLVEYQTGFDSIINKSYKVETEKIAYKYNVEKAVYEVNAKNKIRTLFLLGVFFVIFLSTIIIVILRDKKRKLQEKEKEKEIINNQKEILKKEKEINSLQHKLNAIDVNISAYKELEANVIQYTELINSKKEELFQLMKIDTINYCEQFKKRPIYKRIIELSNQIKDKDYKILTYTEQEVLDQEIKKRFSRFISEVKSSFPGLTDDDIKLCCLSLLKLDTNSISLCFTVSGANTIKQRRFRIKQKMADESGNSLMYDFIFSVVKRM